MCFGKISKRLPFLVIMRGDKFEVGPELGGRSSIYLSSLGILLEKLERHDPLFSNKRSLALATCCGSQLVPLLYTEASDDTRPSKLSNFIDCLLGDL